MPAPDRGRADPAVDARSWAWDESRALPRRSPFSARFIRYTTWAYLALILAPLPIAVVIGLQQFPVLVGPALAFVLWMCPMAVFFGVIIAPVMGLAGACAATAITVMRNRRSGNPSETRRAVRLTCSADAVSRTCRTRLEYSTP